MIYAARRDFLKLAGVGVASLSLGGLLASCSPRSSSSTQSTSKNTGDQVIIAMNTGSEPTAGFDPLFSWGAGEHVHEPLIQSTLITTNADMGFEPDLATSYECSEDGLTWTFAIRDDAFFSDGVQVSAKDAAFTIQGILASQGSEVDLSMVKDAYALNDFALVIELKNPFNSLLYTLAVTGIVPKHAYGEGYGRNPLGSGRYLLEQWNEGQQVILTANPHYYGEAPLMKKVVIVFMEEDAALAAVRSGQIDIAFTTAAFSDQEIEDFELLACKTVDSRGISLPMLPEGSSRTEGESAYQAGNDITSDLALRKAINYALDRESIVEHVLNGYGAPAYSVCDGMPWASTDMIVETDRNKARQVLEEGGWKPDSEGILEKDGVKASFELLYPAADSTRQALATEFSNQMHDLGIEVDLKGLGWDDIYPRQYSDPVLWGWGSNAPTELYELNSSRGWGNFPCYDSPRSDTYFDAALARPDITDSFELWQKAQWDGEVGPAPQGEASWVWLVNVDHLYFKRLGLDVAGQKPHPHGHGWSLVNNVDRWTWNA